MNTKAPIILAVDTSDLELAKAWIAHTAEYIQVFKLGLEFFLNFGSQGVRAITENSDAEIFLDLKLHDIPNTVAQAATNAALMNPLFLTIHASGGSQMIKAAVQSAPGTKIAAVTILTSLSEDDVKAVGFADNALSSATNLAQLAVAAGAAAIVCSPLETASIRSVVGKETLIITPGVRPSSMSGKDDQNRTMTPAQAISAGADFVVIGRPITSAWESSGVEIGKRAREISAEILNS
ncbi:MAG: orotidine-5'-phosphate decarboxylase [Actinobacteria bacterium]|uniref:Orotidine 5'-phosphate decarboxylase n=1 Tax=freshwater metagenome TaxID=449393 RepID=A0A6J6IKV8_9ZZZZ|nr:orotidine-5'-phosphate decarboxylase [Actinomycetota bacterium]